MNREPWVGTQEVADFLGKSVFTVRRWAQTEKIPGVRKGRDWSFQLSAVDDAMKSKPDPWVQSPRSRGRRRAA